MNRTKVLLVDDHPLVRESLTGLIDRQNDMVVCGEAEDTRSALSVIAANRPDVVVLDIALKESSGLDLLRTLREKYPELRTVVLSMHDEKLYAERCIRAGARGYVMKVESTKRTLFAIREVSAGRLCVSEAMGSHFAEKLFSDRSAPASSPLEQLSNRELEVYSMLGNGMDTRQVAESLNVSIKTVQVYCARIKVKLGLATGAELLREAIRWHERGTDKA